jgi:hypothetical protein
MHAVPDDHPLEPPEACYTVPTTRRAARDEPAVDTCGAGFTEFIVEPPLELGEIEVAMTVEHPATLSGAWAAWLVDAARTCPHTLALSIGIYSDTAIELANSKHKM